MDLNLEPVKVDLQIETPSLERGAFYSLCFITENDEAPRTLEVKTLSDLLENGYTREDLAYNFCIGVFAQQGIESVYIRAKRSYETYEEAFSSDSNDNYYYLVIESKDSEVISDFNDFVVSSDDYKLQFYSSNEEPVEGRKLVHYFFDRGSDKNDFYLNKIMGEPDYIEESPSPEEPDVEREGLVFTVQDINIGQGNFTVWSSANFPLGDYQWSLENLDTGTVVASSDGTTTEGFLVKIRESYLEVSIPLDMKATRYEFKSKGRWVGFDVIQQIEAFSEGINVLSGQPKYRVVIEQYAKNFSCHNFYLNEGDLTVPDTLPSHITECDDMFAGCQFFNQDISSWDVSAVENMDSMFYGCESFNQDLSQWCVRLISESPNSFSEGSALSEENLPVWGTCPRGEDEQIDEDIEDAFTFAVQFPEGGDVGVVLLNAKQPWIFKDADTGVILADSFGIAGDNVSIMQSPDFAETAVFVDVLDSAKRTFSLIAECDGVLLGSNIEGFETNGNLVEVLSYYSLISSYGYRFKGVELRVPNFLPRNVTSTNSMFESCYNFNQDISSWDVSNVTSMSGMFEMANAFNQDISSWDVSNVTDMSYMFSMTVFDQPLGLWDVSSVTRMDSMFAQSNMSQDLSEWCVANIHSYPQSFASFSPLEDMPEFHPQWGTCPRGENGEIDEEENPTNFRFRIESGSVTPEQVGFEVYTDFESEPLELVLLDSDTGEYIETIDFSGEGKYGTEYLEGFFDPSFPEEFEDNTYIFYSGLESTINTFEVRSKHSRVSIVRYLSPTSRDYPNAPDDFDGSLEVLSYSTTIPNQITKVENSLLLLPSYIPKAFNNFNDSFSESTHIGTDITGWDVSHVKSMGKTFSRCSNFNQDISRWDVGNVTDMEYMFRGCINFNQDLSSWCVKNISSQPNRFDFDCPSWTLPRPQWGTCPDDGENGQIEDIYEGDEPVRITYDATDVYPDSTVFKIYIGNAYKKWEIRKLGEVVFNSDMTSPNFTLVANSDDNTNIQLMNFEGGVDSLEVYSKGEAVYIEVTSNLGRATSPEITVDSFGSVIQRMTFDTKDCPITLPVELPPNITSLKNMFYNCGGYISDITSWDTTNIVSMESTFSANSSFNQDISNWNTENVLSMRTAFYNCTSFNQDLSSWCVTKIPVEPDYFDLLAESWTLPRPVWGTCPSQVSLDPYNVRLDPYNPDYTPTLRMASVLALEESLTPLQLQQQRLAYPEGAWIGSCGDSFPSRVNWLHKYLSKVDVRKRDATSKVPPLSTTTAEVMKRRATVGSGLTTQGIVIHEQVSLDWIKWALGRKVWNTLYNNERINATSGGLDLVVNDVKEVLNLAIEEEMLSEYRITEVLFDRHSNNLSLKFSCKLMETILFVDISGSLYY